MCKRLLGSDGFFSVHYISDESQRRATIARYRVPADPNAADSGSEVVVLTQEQPFEQSQPRPMQFGPDGFT